MSKEMTKKDIVKIAEAINNFNEGNRLIEKGKQLIAKSEIGFIEYEVYKDVPAMIRVLCCRRVYRIKAEKIIGLIK